MKWYNKISQRGNKIAAISEQIFLSNDQYSCLGKAISKTAFAKTVPCNFEGYTLCILQGWQESLTKSYGSNYMIPPPIEKRVSSHILARLIDTNNYKQR